jgi:hypothetical protein
MGSGRYKANDTGKNLIDLQKPGKIALLRFAMVSLNLSILQIFCFSTWMLRISKVGSLLDPIKYRSLDLEL